MKKRLQCVCFCALEHLSIHCTCSGSEWVFLLNTQSLVHYDKCCGETQDSCWQLVKVKASVSFVRKDSVRELVSFASWLADPGWSSCREWSLTCLKPALQARRLVPSPNLSWRWCHQTAQASCLLQRRARWLHYIKCTCSNIFLISYFKIISKTKKKDLGLSVCILFVPMVWRTESGL